MHTCIYLYINYVTQFLLSWKDYELYNIYILYLTIFLYNYYIEDLLNEELKTISFNLETLET